MRTALTMIGVAWGMFLFVALLGASRGVQNGFDKIFANSATNSLFVWMQQTAIPFEGYQRGRTLELKVDDIEAIKAEFPQIQMIAPRSRSEEHTSELQSRGHRVCRLLLEKKKIRYS